MGEVYRARDSRLQRDVAVKVLPAAFATDEARLSRFEQEALATAALNHPNILVVFDIGREGRTAYVVAELLEGQTLREVIEAGRLPLRKAVDYASQIASGLAAAHAKGIVHRDLKPENVFVTAEERVKILDFGLAKLTEGSSSTSATSTVLSPRTEPGMVVGTLGYMSPEQVRGLAVDHRADIFSFGAVLYEMLAGRRAFRGDTAADTMTAILKEAPPELADSGSAVPPTLARVVDRCLEKAPGSRFQSASDLAFALQALGSDARSGSSISAAPADRPEPRQKRPWMLVAGVAFGAIALTAAISWSLRPVPTLLPALEVDVAAPPGHVTGETSALSPDGSRLALTASDTAGRTQIWIRTLESGVTTPVAGTDEARNPFWSADGSQIGFFSGGRLKAVTVANGRVRVICDAGGARQAGTWNAQDVIVFALEAGMPLKRVDAGGGVAPVDLKTLGFRPHFLPDGRHYLFHTQSRPTDPGDLGVADLDSDSSVSLAVGRDATYADGHVLFVRGTSLLAQPFDLATRTPSGEPVVLAEVGLYLAATGPNYSVAGGLIAFRRTVDPHRRLVWHSRDGARLGEIPGDGDWGNPSLSPDDSRVAAQRDERQGTRGDIWVIDIERGTTRALSAETGHEQTPTWSSGSDRVVFQNLLSLAPTTISRKPLAGGGPESIGAGVQGTFIDLMPDGRSALSFAIVEGNRDILITPLDGKGPPVPFARSTFNEIQPALSPDGKWLAYVSDELGINVQRDVYIQAFPGGGRKIHVSEDSRGGQQPRWRRDGRELFYVAPDKRLIAVPVESTGDTLRLGPARPLFQTAIGSETGIGTRASYDVTRDGRKFIVAESPAGREGADVPFTVLVNWRSLVAKGVRPVDSPGGR